MRNNKIQHKEKKISKFFLQIALIFVDFLTFFKFLVIKGHISMHRCTGRAGWRLQPPEDRQNPYLREKMFGKNHLLFWVNKNVKWGSKKS